jgi:hypothetical protein
VPFATDWSLLYRSPTWCACVSLCVIYRGPEPDLGCKAIKLSIKFLSKKYKKFPYAPSSNDIEYRFLVFTDGVTQMTFLRAFTPRSVMCLFGRFVFPSSR